jgi:hypothetical protein
MEFLNGWSIEVDNIPVYTEFIQTEFTEEIDVNILEQIMKSPDSEYKPFIKKTLQSRILNFIDPNTSSLKVGYHHAIPGVGRVHANNNISTLPMARIVKHTVFEIQGWFDLDIVKSYPTMVYEVGRLNDIDFPSVKRYIDNFDSIVIELREHYGDQITSAQFKVLFLNTFFGGTHATWLYNLTHEDKKILDHEKDDDINKFGAYCNKNNPKYYPVIPKLNTRKEHPIYSAYIEEISKFRKLVIKHNTQLRDKIDESLQIRYSEYVYGKITPKKMDNKVIHYFFGVIENHILYTSYLHLVKTGIIIPGKCGLEFDGLCIPPPPIPFNMKRLICGLEKEVLTKTGLHIKFKHKPYEDSVKSVVAYIEALNVETAKNKKQKNKQEELSSEIVQGFNEIVTSKWYSSDDTTD